MKMTMLVLISYLIGCFPSAYFLGKMYKNIDIRNHGSGNSGSTNALRVMGTKFGILTLALDVIKGIVAVLIGRLILGDQGALISGVLVVLGHNFPIFLKFKGGKGVATSIGVLMILTWQTALTVVIIGVITIIITRYVSLGSILGGISAPITAVLVMQTMDKPLFITVVILASLLIIRHKDNIKRLCKGEENKFGNKI